MISVTCAVIRNEENDVLVVQRGESTDHPFRWEFPGGKLDENETEEECIIREIREELSIEIVICGKMQPVEHDYGHKKIKLIPFICDTLEELPLLSEHIGFRWVSPDDLTSVDFSEADVFVARNYLGEIVKSENHEMNITAATTSAVVDEEELKSMINRMMSMKEAEWIATSAVSNPEIFNRLIEYSYSPDKKLAFHASWALSKVCDKYPELIDPYLPAMILSLEKLDNESVKRSFLRIISNKEMSTINIRYHGILAEYCFNELRSGFSAIAIKAYSMEVLYRLVLLYPELGNELSSSISLLQGESSAGIKARGYLILKKLAGMPVKLKSSQ